MIPNFFDKLIKKKTPVLANKQHAKMEDITYVRNLQEKLASLEVGQCFALATRKGHHIFKLIKIDPYQQEDKSQERSR